MMIPVAPRTGRGLAALAALLLTGCAAPTQTTPAPVYRQAEASAGGEGPREDFDPARFREDLLLIQPLFSPPAAPVDTVAATSVAAASAAHPTPPPPADLAAAPVGQAVYQVQVIALSREDAARRIAAELGRRFGLAADVVPQGSLFAVRVGRFADAADAGELKGRIATLSQGYAGAFVVGDSLTVGLADSSLLPTDGAAATVAVDAAGMALDSAAVETAGVDTAGDRDLDGTGLDLPEAELVATRGWRVLVEQFSDQEAAQDYRARVIKRLRRDDVDVKFEPPWFKIMAGSFRTQAEAQRFAERCRSLGYRNAARVPGVVYLAPEDVR